MRSWKPQLALASAAVAVLALAATLFARGGVVDVLVMILIGAALLGMYGLRSYARAELLYHRHAESRRPAHPAEPDPVRSGGTSAVHARADQRTSVADRDVNLHRRIAAAR